VSAKRKWMQKAFGAHPGALHRAMGVPEGKKIPTAKLAGRLAALRRKKNRTAKETKMMRRMILAMRVKKGDLGHA
jgi:hypothetical protein